MTPLLLLALLAAWLGPTPPPLAEPSRSEVRFSDPEPLLAIDSLLSVDNRGLTRVFVVLNEHQFKLVTDPAEVARSTNAFLIPLEGAITIDIGDLLEPDDENPFDDDCTAPVPNGNNCIEFVPQGTDGTSAQIVVSDTPIEGLGIAYAVTRADLEPLPAAFALGPSYPNPFTDRTTIRYTVPEERSSGVPLTLAIYDLLGRRVRTLVDARQFPGTFTVEWDGRDGAGHPVAGGLYVCLLVSDGWQRSLLLTRLR